MQGLNRFEWDMRYPDAAGLDGAMTFVVGPVAKPGNYQATLNHGDVTQTVSFEIRKDPRLSATDADLAAQFDLLLAIRDKQTAVHETANAIKKMKADIQSWAERAEEGSALSVSCNAVSSKLTAVEDTLVQVKGATFFDMNHEARLADQLGNLPSVIASADTRPTQQAMDAYNEYGTQADAAISAFEAILGDDLQALNDLIQASDLPAISR